MGTYVDGFVVPIKKDKVEEYRRMATQAGELWKEFGALEYVECVAEDVKPGEVTSFPQSVKLEDDETVVFSWIVYESRAARDECMEKVMADERMQPDENVDEIMSMKRMFFGGFEKIVEL